MVDLVPADLDQLFGAAQHAGRRPANLDVCLGAHRLELEHGVERRDFEHADVGHAQHVGDRLYRRAGDPAFLLLGAPQDWNDCRLLPAGGIFGDLGFGPAQVVAGEGERGGLHGLICKTTDGH